METVEHSARIMAVAEMLGGASVLPREEVRKLIDARGRYGFVSRSGAAPGCPVAAEDLPPQSHEKFWVTRDELVALVEEALRQKGLA
jgi:hypothetical protein